MVRDLEHLRLVASAVAGCTLEVAADDGELAWTDGSTVFVPSDATGAEQIRMIGVQASLVAAGSLDPGVVRSLSRRPQLTRRYLAVEAHRALAANEEVLPPTVRRLIDASVAAGLETPEASLEAARSRRSGHDEVALVFGTINVRRLLAAIDRSDAPTPVAAGTTPSGTKDVSRLIELPEDEDDDDGLGDVLSSPVGGGGAVGRLFRRLLSPARRRGGGGPPGADAPTHVGTGRRGAGRRAVAAGAQAGALASISLARPGTAYPEWDLHRRRYRPDWCTVVDVDPLTVGVAATMPDGLALRRSLARVGLGLTRCRRQRQGDDIDIDAAVEARVDALAGSPHDDEFYLDILRHRRGLAVLVLLDISGSAAEPGIGGKTVHEHQRSAAAALTTALHGLGDRVALYAFNSRGRAAVQLLRVKAFDDHLDGDVIRRLTGLTPGAYTRLGAAIRHGTSILEERGGTPRRLLVVLSDGLAYDHGYEGRYGEADARRALIEARRRGVGCLCLSVGTDVEPAALRRVFGAAAHATVPRAEQLPGLIGPLFRAALGSAEVQRRSFQRKERTRGRLEIERRSDDSSGSAVLPARR